eukprot:2650674-Amphidinium_carterae.1
MSGHPRLHPSRHQSAHRTAPLSMLKHWIISAFDDLWVSPPQPRGQSRQLALCRRRLKQRVQPCRNPLRLRPYPHAVYRR